MPARIVVSTGPSAGIRHWIEVPVLRIGSDASAHICLRSADVVGHAATLEFRNGDYRLHNKSDRTIAIDGNSVAIGTFLNWRNGQKLILSPTVELVLEVETDPRPSPRPKKQELVEPSQPTVQRQKGIPAPDAQETEEGAKSGNSAMVQLLVIVACIAGSGLLLLRGPSSPEPAAGPKFSELVDGLQHNKYLSPALLRRVQNAQAAYVRGAKEDARHRFQELRDDLIKEKVAWSNVDPKHDILKFVEYQLGRLD